MSALRGAFVGACIGGGVGVLGGAAGIPLIASICAAVLLTAAVLVAAVKSP